MPTGGDGGNFLTSQDQGIEDQRGKGGKEWEQASLYGRLGRAVGSRAGGSEIFGEAHTNLPRTLHMKPSLKLSPGPIAAAHATTPGGEAAQLSVVEAPPSCKETRSPQAQAWVPEAGQGWEGGVSGKGAESVLEREVRG